VKTLSSFMMILLPLCWLGLARAQSAELETPAWSYDEENAQEILETCAGCHGRDARGGKGGIYPRLAGLDATYLARQIRAFKALDRINIPMYPYATERELPSNDIRDIARLLSQMELPTEMPPLADDAGALEVLLAAEAVFNIARVEGDADRGAELYEEECAECHGAEGWGEGHVPQLAGQYTPYLRRQIEEFRSGKRRNEDMDDVLESIDEDDLQDLFAYLASRDD
jgi:cytochrome c553